MHTVTHDELYTRKRPTDASFACSRAPSVGARVRPLAPFPAIPAFPQPPGVCGSGVPREGPWTCTWLAHGHPTSCNVHPRGGPYCNASRALGRLPAAPPSPLWPSCITTAPLMPGIAVELMKYEVGREQDAKGVVRMLRGPCRRRRLGPAGTKTTRLVSVSERGHACRARAVETYPARLLLEVVDELQPPGW